MIRGLYKKFLLLGMAVLFGAVLFACNKSSYPNHTVVFYINDYAMAFSEYTRQSILYEAEAIYNRSEDLNDGGVQLVVATFSLKDESDIESFDKTDLYRDWKIGTNDMGLLILLFFKEEKIDGITYQNFLELQIEVGYRMEPYLTPSRLGQITDQTFFNPEYYGDVDLGIMHLFYSILEILYTEAYGYNSFDYDMTIFEEDLNMFIPTYYVDQKPISIWTYVEFPLLLLGSGFPIYISVGLLIVIGGGFGLLKITRGKGGSSGGMGIFRKRR